MLDGLIFHSINKKRGGIRGEIGQGRGDICLICLVALRRCMVAGVNILCFKKFNDKMRVVMKNYLNYLSALIGTVFFTAGAQAALLSQSVVPLNDNHNGFAQSVTIDSVTVSNPANTMATLYISGNGNYKGDSLLAPANVAKKTLPLSSPVTLTPPVFNSNGSINYYPMSSMLQASFLAQKSGQYILPSAASIVSWNRNLPTTIRSSSGTCVNQPGWSTGQGVNLIQWGCQGQDNDTWNLIPTADYYHIVVKNGNLCLNVPGNSTAAGQKLIQYGCQDDNSFNDQWSIVDNNDGTYRIQSRSSGLCVNMAGGTNYSPVTQDSCSLPTTKLQLPNLPAKWGTAAHL